MKKKSPEVSIIIPVYNEENTIGEVLERVLGLKNFSFELLVVNDGSTDRTPEVLEEYQKKDERIRVIHHKLNRGKGAALRTAFSRAQGKMVIIQDADLEYQPEKIPELIRPIKEGKADAVYGSRFRNFPSRVFFFQHLANRFLTLLTNFLYGCWLTDMETCQKVLKKDLLSSLKLSSEGFEIEPEITAKILRQGYRIVEIPIPYQAREKKKGKKIGWRDGFKAIWTLIKCRFG